jgi:signal transduction histidine kinase/CheY-like chemotaxis protein
MERIKQALNLTKIDVYNILIHSPVAICIFRGKNYIIEFANDFYLEILGKTKDITGKPLFNIFPELKNQDTQALLDKVMNTGTPCFVDEHKVVFLKYGQEQVCFFNCIYQPTREQNGKITGIIVLFTEITQQVIAKKITLENQTKLAAELSIANTELAIQKEEKRKRAIELGIANIELAFQEDEKGKRAIELGIANIELAFQEDEKGKRAVELGIANIELAFQEDEKGKRAAELTIANIELAFQENEKEKRAAELSIANIELAFQENEKEKRAAELSIANIELAFQEDEKGKRAAELTIANIELAFQEDEKGKRAAELTIADLELEFQNKEKVKREIVNKELEAAKIEAEKATQIANEAVKSKQQFLSNMSHEIRTPMNAIIGFTKVLLKTELTAKQNEYLTAIKISGDALIVLINDILDLAKVDAGKMSFEKTPFKVASSISAMLHLFETKIQEKNLSLIKKYDSKIPEVLIGDPVRLHQIILNLVSNAVKFTAEGNITISVNLLKENEESVTIEFAVTDTGIGITENKIERVFDNFQQASSNTARIFGGTGLGLAIVKQLVEQQGGNVQVKSQLGKGATFSFTLDFLKTTEKANAETESVELALGITNIKVLVVEDMILNQLLMRTILDEFGFERDIASNGKIAIEKLGEKNYDIILMDLQMPEMNGFEATHYIRNTLKSNIPIIALTADVTTVDLAKCKAVGMNDYLAKPIDERLLHSKIVNLVKKQLLYFGNQPKL